MTIFSIDILCLLSWIVTGLFFGHILPFLATFLAPTFQISSDIATNKNNFNKSGFIYLLKGKNTQLLYIVSGSLLGGIFYRIFSGSNFHNYDIGSYFFVIIGTIWFFLVCKFNEVEKK